jgi:hypothetical protein
MITVLIKAGGLLAEYLKPDMDAHTRRVEARDGETLRQILESIAVPPVFCRAYRSSHLGSMLCGDGGKSDDWRCGVPNA